jgi:MFS family permease
MGGYPPYTYGKHERLLLVLCLLTLLQPRTEIAAKRSGDRLSEANVVAAQSAIADVIAPQERNRFFGYIYLSASSAYIVGPLVGGNWRIRPWFHGSTLQLRFGRR